MKPSGRFVILRHDHPELHFDFMLQHADALRTWRLAIPPEAGTLEALRLPDHRLAYLDYEGPISNQRGNVMRWDQGFFLLRNSSDVGFQAILIGDASRLELTAVPQDETHWRFTFREPNGSPACETRLQHGQDARATE